MEKEKGLTTLYSRTMGRVPARLVLAGMSMLGFLNLYMVRLNLSVILVAMVRRNASLEANTAPCLRQVTSNASLGEEDVYQEGEMDWSETVQGFVLGSFYYGYATSQIIGGRSAELYGTRWLFGGCILAGGVASILTPVASRIHYGLLITVRLLQGICQGVAWPAMHALVVKWIPPMERPRFIGFVYFITQIGVSLTLAMCGFIIAAWGWAAAFYLTGFLSLAWCVLWFSFMYNSPAEHPRISKKELDYIEHAVRASGTSSDSDKQQQRVPWKQMLSSLPMWAILVHGIGNNWSIGIFYNYLPTYMKNILGFSIKANGMLSALPFLSRYLGAITWSSLGDFLTSRGYISILTCRRGASIIAMWLPGAMLLCLAYTECNWQAAITLMCVALFCNGAISASYIVNHTDIAPNFAGTLFGMDNTVGSVVSFIAPVVVGVFTDGQQTLSQWRKVFWTCVPLYVLTEVFYLIFASATVQPWNHAGLIPLQKDESEEEDRQAFDIRQDTVA